MSKLLSLCFIFLANIPAVAQPSAPVAPAVMDVIPMADSVSLYDKFEARLVIKANFVNPFDPEDVDIMVTFTAPSGKRWNIPGFYQYTFGTMWKVRFAPDETGTWTYVVRVRDRQGESTGTRRSFKAVPSKFKGPVRIADNKRYLEYHNGSPFYGVGLWYNGMVTADNLDELKSKGVNFISNFITPLETMGSGVGRYDQDVCGRIDELFALCEEREILISLNLWFHSFLSETVWGGFNIRWHTNPYQQVTSSREFFRSTAAWKYQEKLYRYFIARWGYSRSLAIWFLVDEINGTDGWVSGDSVQAGRWTKNVHDFFKKNDPYNHPTTATRSGGLKEFFHDGYQATDIAAREIYEAQGYPINHAGTIDSASIHPLKNSYMNYGNQIRTIWDGYQKPVIIGETGWDHTYYEPGMPGYIAAHHNALWVSLATGAAMTPFWWAFSTKMNDVITSKQLLSLRKFSDNIPFSQLRNPVRVPVKISGGDGFAMQGGDTIFGWVVDPDGDVAGDRVSIAAGRSGKYKLRLYHTWRGDFIKEEELNTTADEVTFTIPSLQTTQSHANYIGQDVAFILEFIKELPVADGKSNRKKSGRP
ncbi:MAG TPA: DUF5060 domain-containing protein [Chryseolinea sp.]|nr:DUF5060 domain-containing protein [Chryseolinea sp.]